ncbi:hypothetical protein PWT90_07329 [Aphanocladium album]|nr:hypothetical protein PWT90_07329 [Aphanocladium album]
MRFRVIVSRFCLGGLGPAGSWRDAVEAAAIAHIATTASEGGETTGGGAVEVCRHLNSRLRGGGLGDGGASVV